MPRLCRHVLVLFTLLFTLLVSPVWGLQVQDSEPLLGNALAVLRVNDLVWLERQAAGYAAAAGIDPSGTRSKVAQWLFCSRGLGGIDLNRPALVAWRPGKAPLLAIIPLRDRPAFIAGFGQSSHFGPPLIRIGEKEGTTVFSQNTTHGLIEYRLLVQNDTAYLAPTVDDCRVLATHQLSRTGQRAPVELTCKPGFLIKQCEGLPQATMPGVPFDLEPNLVTLLARFGAGVRDDVLGQIASITVEARAVGDTGVVVEGRVQTRADSALAQLISAQKNQGSRLLPILRSPHTVMSLHGSITWQGQLDRIGQKVASTAHAQLGDRWTSALEDTWRESWATRDRNGAFAVACDMAPRQGQPGVDLVVKMVVEQAQAAEQVVRARQLAEVLAPLVDASFSPDAVLSHAFSDVDISGLHGFRHLVNGTIKGRPATFDHVALAVAHHVLSVEAADGRADQRIAELTPKLFNEASQKPEGAAALVAFTYDPAIEARTLLAGQISHLDPAAVIAWIKSTPQGDLTFHLELPLIALAVVERELRNASPAAADPKP